MLTHGCMKVFTSAGVGLLFLFMSSCEDETPPTLVPLPATTSSTSIPGEDVPVPPSDLIPHDEQFTTIGD